MKEKFSRNVFRYAAVTALLGMSYSPLYLNTYDRIILNTFSIHEGVRTHIFTVLGFSLPLLLVIIGGIVADIYGRRRVWALAVCAFGVGSLWLYNSASVPDSAIFVSGIAIIILLSMFTAWKNGSIAWLFDHEGREGIAIAHGVLFLLVSVFILSGYVVHTLDPDWVPSSLVYTLQYVGILLVGIYMITFPENYGNQHGSFRETGKEGLFQCLSNRVVQLVGIHFFISGFSFSNSFLFISLLGTYNDPFFNVDFNTYFGIAYFCGFFFAGVLLFLIFLYVNPHSKYTNVIIYPRLFMMALYFIIATIPSFPVFFIFHGVIIVLSLISNVAILMLMTQVIKKNLATVISLLVIPIFISSFLSYRGMSFSYGFGWDTLCILNGLLAAASLGILLYAAGYNQKDEITMDTDTDIDTDEEIID
ncbi:MAG: hypothetical protein HXS47_01450 [Theionarchaea archaeon]|nr:hypothetical protein [Theionarchaea archaeon]